MSSHPAPYTASSVSSPPGYSHAMLAGGLIFVSGQVAFDSDGSIVGVDDIGAQTRQAFRNLAAVLEAAGATFADVAKLTYFVRDVEAVGVIRAVRDEFVDTANPPASTLVEVSRLIAPELLIEIEAVAIETSSFNKLRPDTYRLNVTLKNQASTAVAMPALELTLTDVQDQAVVRRVLQAADFAPGTSSLGARADWSTSLAIAVNASAAGGRIAGYRVLAFYP